MENSKIEWTTHTVNFWWGCVKVSAGCEHCYAETFSKRVGRDIWGPAKTTERWRTKGPWRDILKWDQQAKADGVRQRVFCQSMSDFFEDHPQLARWREEAIRILEDLKWLDVQLLTKRPENISHMVPAHRMENWPKHVWIGTSVEDQAAANKRVPELLKVPASVRFLSCEPLLGSVSLDRWFGLEPGNEWLECLCDEIDPADRPCIVCESRLELGQASGIHWVICGGESGHHARPMHPDWARSLRDQCQTAGVAYFFKQWGEWYPDNKGIYGVRSMHCGDTVIHKLGKQAAGRLLDGQEWNQFPVAVLA